MPDGGGIFIQSRNADVGDERARELAPMEPGAYVRLAVTEGGHGMDEAVRAQLFEPFFTTKPQGKGTGLGLATVYGIVKQSGGSIWCQSEPGMGTTFEIYVPQVNARPTPQQTTSGGTAQLHGTETVLVVEDDDALRTLACRSLDRFGYNVLCASSVHEAQRLIETYPHPVHLLVSDIVMPGMNGQQLAEWIAAVRPGIRVLWMSGYTADALCDRSLTVASTAFLQKPFIPEQLVQKVRAVLDGGSPAHGGGGWMAQGLAGPRETGSFAHQRPAVLRARMGPLTEAAGA